MSESGRLRHGSKATRSAPAALRGILSAKKRARGRSARRKTLPIPTAYSRASKFLARQGSTAILGSVEEFSKRYANNLQIRSVVNQIDRVEELIEIATSPRQRLRELISALFTGPKTVEFTDTEVRVLTTKHALIPLRYLSSGEKHLLRILIDTVRIDESAILIDEPELSMHVDWQKTLVASMAQLNPNAQIVLASHSPEVMADLPDSKIFRL